METLKFIEIYKAQDNETKREIREIALLRGSKDYAESTFGSWFRTKRFPKRVKQALSNFLNKTVEELF